MEVQTIGAAQHWLAGRWLADGSLDAVAEINTQCLEYLSAMAAVPVRLVLFAGQPASLAGSAVAWRDLSAGAKARLAASPYLLADAGFDDETRWLALEQRMVQDLPPVQVEPVFTGSGAGDFIRRVLVLGWHLARANRQLARVVMGMSPGAASRIAALRLQDLDWLAQHRPGWVRPRWEHQPRIWRHLLLAAADPDGGVLTQVSLRGLQLMAANVLGAEAGAVRARRGL
jgi:hypothetical protein